MKVLLLLLFPQPIRVKKNLSKMKFLRTIDFSTFQLFQVPIFEFWCKFWKNFPF